MFRTKIAGLTAIGLLAMGVSSPALAVPIINVSYGTDLVTDPGDPGGQVRNYNFTVSYTSCDVEDPAVVGDPCDPIDGLGPNLIFFDLEFAFDDVIAILDITLDALTMDPLDWDTFFNPSVEGAEGANAGFDFFGLDSLVETIFSFTVQVDFGQALTLLGPNPIFNFYTYDGFEELLFDVTAGFDGSLGTEDDPVMQVPEPGTLVLFGIGLLGMGAARRRKT